MNKFPKLTKIVATIGPATDTKTKIEQLIRAGVNVFRFNTKHGNPSWHEKRMQLVQAVADELKRPIGILLDLQGPEIRIETKEQKDVVLAKKQEVSLGMTFDEGCQLAIPHKAVFDALKKGDRVLIEDGHIIMHVKDVIGNLAILYSNKKVTIKHRKGVNIPGKHINLPSLIKADLQQLDLAAMNKVDFIALSFARNARDLKILKREMEKREIKAHVITKVENQQALDNIDELIHLSDGVMVARGDLGVEVPIEKLLYWQKIITDKCQRAYKPVITATEMLDSMIRNPRPTRAEATDVSNAVYEGTDAVMLSGETAGGEYPVEAVEMMSKIAQFTESVKKFEVVETPAIDATQLIGRAAMQMIITEGVKVDKIVVFTQTGYTAKVIASYRPDVPIIAITNRQDTVEKLTLAYGIYGYRFRFPEGRFISPEFVMKKLRRRSAISKGDTVLIVHGARWKKPGLTNTISLLTY